MDKQRWRTAACLAAALAQGVPDAARADAPWWSHDLPPTVQAGGSSGKACVASALPKGEMLMPAHCAPSFDHASPGKDYAWSSQQSQGSTLTPGLIARRRHAPGEGAWIQQGSTWTKARIAASSGSSYWIQAPGASFCPGTSGSPVWVAEDGEPRWLAMIVSGGESLATSGCSSQAAAVAASAIDWPWER